MIDTIQDTASISQYFWMQQKYYSLREKMTVKKTS